MRWRTRPRSGGRSRRSGGRVPPGGVNDRELPRDGGGQTVCHAGSAAAPRGNSGRAGRREVGPVTIPKRRVPRQITDARSRKAFLLLLTDPPFSPADRNKLEENSPKLKEERAQKPDRFPRKPRSVTAWTNLSWSRWRRLRCEGRVIRGRRSVVRPSTTCVLSRSKACPMRLPPLRLVRPSRSTQPHEILTSG